MEGKIRGMKLYPLMANLEGRTVLVVGGGTVATRKVKALLDTGAEIRVVSPAFTDEIRSLIDEKKIRGFQRNFTPSDLDGVSLVFAATDDPALNESISREAKARNIPVNDVTNPEQCGFFVPSHIRRGDLILAISTSGKSPALAKWLRQKIEEEIGREYEILTEWMGIIRDYLLAHGYSHEQIRNLSEALLRKELVENLRSNDKAALSKALEAAFRSALNHGVPPDLATSLGVS